MGVITLTDRISVRVAAKNDTESSNQKKRDGGNVASALGAGNNLYDSEKESLGEKLGETVTGEDGKTYVKADKIGGALKWLSQNGKLSNDATHDGITVGNTVYTLDNVYAGPTVIEVQHYINVTGEGYVYKPYYHYTIPAGAYLVMYSSNNSEIAFMFFSKEDFSVLKSSFWYDKQGQQQQGSDTLLEGHASSYPLNDVTYSYFVHGFRDSDTHSTSMNNSVPDHLVTTKYAGRGFDGIYPYIVGWLFGSVTGGPGVDPVGKTDEQIKEEILSKAREANAVTNFGSNPNDTYVAVTDANGNPIYFLGT